MARKVIIDCDPGIDDALAVVLAMFDPGLEVVAVTATAGNVSAVQASRNVQTIIDQIDPPRFPRVGAAIVDENAPALDRTHLFGQDGLGNTSLPVSELHHQHPSVKMICDEVRAAPEEVTIIALGPLTNIARAFQRDPTLPSMVDQIIISGGSVSGIGNATACAEFNMYYDPLSAQQVFRSATTKTLVPLDISKKITLTLNMMDELTKGETRAGEFMGNVLPFAFRAYHQLLGQEAIQLNECAALAFALQPKLFETEEMAGDVETAGLLTTGATVFDRRPQPQWRANMEVVTSIDKPAVTDCILRGLKQAGSMT